MLSPMRQAVDGVHSGRPRTVTGVDGSLANAAVDREPWTVVGPAGAPAIVFIHGTRLNRRQWQPQMRRLSGRFRCIAIDLPGHGVRSAEPFATASACAAVVDAIKANAPSGRAVLVGLSLGGYVAIDVAEAAPERVAGLVLAGCSAEPIGPSAVGIRLLAYTLERAPAGLLNAVNRWFFRLRYGRPTADPMIQAGFGLAGGARALRILIGRRYLERLGRLWTPVLIVNGALDPVFGPGGDPWAAACRRGRHAVVARAMHLSNLDRPGPFSELVADFADEVAQDANAA